MQAFDRLNDELARTNQRAEIAGRLGLTTAQSILEVVLRYYPAERLAVRTQLLIEEMFE